ncbi:MAG: DNA-binding response regulator [Elusimicrobia bacterium RBG_16_66_12]|nr:MAG: DNA-binding response regulator [Elusimicrobia bacterium RBG_16_66_12]
MGSWYHVTVAQEKILVVEDDKDIVKLLRYNLEKEGWRVVAAADGEAGLACLRRERPDLLILDVMIPKLDGFEVVKAVRRESRVPVLMLTARKEELDRVLGLELGADDYVTKPFSVREVLARVKALLRRSAPAAQSTPGGLLRAGGVELDPERYEVRVRGRAVELTTKEFDFLKVLLQAAGRALTREQLLEKVWGYDRSLDLDTRTVDQHVTRLRDKLGAEGSIVATVKNVGYRIKAAP